MDIPRIFFLATSSAVAMRFFTLCLEYGIKDMQVTEGAVSFLGNMPREKGLRLWPTERRELGWMMIWHRISNEVAYL